jgi:hypothetical protein
MEYTNTIIASAYSLGVDVDLLQQALEPLRAATEIKKDMNSKTHHHIINSPKYHTIIVHLNKNLNQKNV